MANVVLTVTLGQSITGTGTYSLKDSTIADPNGTAPATTTVAADVATLVADGATPTQAHVTTLNTDWGTFLTSLTAYTGGVGNLSKDFTFMYNPSTVTKMNQVRSALRHLERLLAGRLGE